MTLNTGKEGSLDGSAEVACSSKPKVTLVKRASSGKPSTEIKIIHLSARVDGTRDLREAAHAAVGVQESDDAISEIFPLEEQYLSYAPDGVEE